MQTTELTFKRAFEVHRAGVCRSLPASGPLHVGMSVLMGTGGLMGNGPPVPINTDMPANQHNILRERTPGIELASALES